MLTHLTHILLDAARMGELMDEAKKLNPEHDSLYRGRSEESLSEIAPYIFTFRHHTEFGKWYMEKGWGDAWGVLMKSSYPLQELHKHFRKFLLVTTEDGQELYFRFYDPRVLRIFLPTCDAAQLREIFGPIEYFAMEDEDGAYTRFWHENGVLRTQKMALEEAGKNKLPHTPATQNDKPEAQKTEPESPQKKTLKSKWNLFED